MNRENMDSVVELAFRRYSKLKNKITRGFITSEHVKLVSEALFLKELANEELNEMWNASYDFFNKLYCEFDESGEIKGFKPYSEEISFVKDTQSAWSEVINQEARNRRSKGLMKMNK